MTRGYRREEVDAFLDDIIADYQKMADLDNEVVKLSEENNKLKRTRIEIACGYFKTTRKQNFSANGNAASNTNNNNNVDILKRISNLEKQFLVNNKTSNHNKYDVQVVIIAYIKISFVFSKLILFYLF